MAGCSTLPRPRRSPTCRPARSCSPGLPEALAAPMQRLAGLLAALPQRFAYAMAALIEERGGVPEAAPTEAVRSRAGRRRGADVGGGRQGRERTVETDAVVRPAGGGRRREPAASTENHRSSKKRQKRQPPSRRPNSRSLRAPASERGDRVVRRPAVREPSAPQALTATQIERFYTDGKREKGNGKQAEHSR